MSSNYDTLMPSSALQLMNGVPPIDPETGAKLTYWQRFRLFWRRGVRDLGLNLAMIWPVLPGLLVYSFTAAAGLLSAEYAHGQVRTYPNAVYLTWITMTTVGFGDVVPTTHVGKAIVVVDALVGLVVFGIVVWLVTTSLTRSEFVPTGAAAKPANVEPATEPVRHRELLVLADDAVVESAGREREVREALGWIHLDVELDSAEGVMRRLHVYGRLRGR